MGEWLVGDGRWMDEWSMGDGRWVNGGWVNG